MIRDRRQGKLALDPPPPANLNMRPIASIAGLRERARITVDPTAKATIYAAIDMLETAYEKIAELRAKDLTH